MPLDNYDLPPLRVACKRELEVVLCFFFFGRSPRHHHLTSKTATTTILPIHENSLSRAPQPPHDLYLSPLPLQHVSMRLPQYVHGQVTMIRGSRHNYVSSHSLIGIFFLGFFFDDNRARDASDAFQALVSLFFIHY